MRCFQTLYPVGGRQFESFVFAASYEHAVQLIQDRHIGEEIQGVVTDLTEKRRQVPSLFYEKRDLLPCIHGIAFYSWLINKRGVMPSDAFSDLVLSDVGVLHDVMHELEFPQHFQYRLAVHQRIQLLETMVPGLVPR